MQFDEKFPSSPAGRVDAVDGSPRPGTKRDVLDGPAMERLRAAGLASASPDRAKALHSVQSRVRLDVLEALRLPAVRLILQDRKELLSQHGIHLENEIDHATSMRLYAVLNTYNPELGDDIINLLAGISALSAAQGFEELAEAANELGRPLFSAAGATFASTAELAAYAATEMPEVFELARSRVRSGRSRRFTEYVPKEPAPISLARIESVRSELEEALGAYFATCTGDSFCELVPTDSKHDVVMLLRHAGPPIPRAFWTPLAARQSQKRP